MRSFLVLLVMVIGCGSRSPHVDSRAGGGSGSAAAGGTATGGQGGAAGGEGGGTGVGGGLDNGVGGGGVGGGVGGGTGGGTGGGVGGGVGGNPMVDAGSPAQTQVEQVAAAGHWPTVALTADRLYVAYMKTGADTHAAVSVLTRGSGAWSHVSFPETSTRPVVRVGSNAKAYFLDCTVTGQLVYKESTDFGATWTNVSLGSYAAFNLTRDEIDAIRLTADLVVDASNRPHLFVPIYVPSGGGFTRYVTVHLWKDIAWMAEQLDPAAFVTTAPRAVAYPNGAIDVVYGAEISTPGHSVRRARWLNGSWSYVELTSGAGYTPPNLTLDFRSMHPVAASGQSLMVALSTQAEYPEREEISTWVDGGMSLARTISLHWPQMNLALETDAAGRPLIVLSFQMGNWAPTAPTYSMELLRQAPDAGWVSSQLLTGQHQALAVDGHTLFIAFSDAANRLQLARVPLAELH